MTFFLIPLLVALSVFNAEAAVHRPNQYPQNSWVYFGRGLNQREIIDLARPHELESSSTSTTTTTQKAIETTLESIITTLGPTTTTPLATTAAPVPTRYVPAIRQLPEVVVIDSTTAESVDETLALTEQPEKEVVSEKVATSESPLRAKIVVIPKEIVATTEATEELIIEEQSSSTTRAVIAPEATSAATHKSKESSGSSEETVAIPSLRTMLRRIFHGDDAALLHHKA